MLVLVVGSVLGLLLFVHGVRRFLLGNILARLQPVASAAVTPGFVAVTGKVTAGQSLISPLTKKNCVFYEDELCQYVRVATSTSSRRSSSSKQWRTVFTYQQATPFEITEGGTSVSVQPQGAEWEIADSALFDVPGTVSPIAFVHRADTLRTIAPTVVPKPKSQRQSDGPLGATEAEEWTLKVGDTVHIVGHYNGQNITKKGILLISDKPGSKYAKQFKRQGVTSCVLGVLLVIAAVVVRTMLAQG